MGLDYSNDFSIMMYAWIADQNPMKLIQQMDDDLSCTETGIFWSHYANILTAAAVACGIGRAAAAMDAIDCIRQVSHSFIR